MAVVALLALLLVTTAAPASAVMGVAHLEVEVSGPGTATGGEDIDLDVSVTNKGLSAASELTVSASLPDGFNWDGASPSGWSCAEETATQVRAWGLSGSNAISVPSTLDDVTAIAAGVSHSLALLANGTVVVWGDNGNGQLVVPTVLTGVSKIAAGGNHSLALSTEGTVHAWGFNGTGQTDVPIELDAISVAAGSAHSLALLESGSIVAWGHDHLGQASVPALDDVIAIAAGGNHSLALRAGGTVVAWGDNDDGQATVPGGLQDVTAIAAGAAHSLALRADGTVVAWGSPQDGRIDVPLGLDDVTAIVAGDAHSLALRMDGTAVGWGYDGYGEASVPADLHITAVAAGANFSLALVRGSPTIDCFYAGTLTAKERVGLRLTATTDALLDGSFEVAVAGTSATTVNPHPADARASHTVTVTPHTPVTRTPRAPDADPDPAPEPAPAPPVFSDVTGGDTHATAIARLTAAGIIRGTTSTTFSPEVSSSRGQMAQFAVRLLQVLDDGAITGVDQDPDAALAELVELGIVVGDRDGELHAEQDLTRGQVSSILARLLTLRDPDLLAGSGSGVADHGLVDITGTAHEDSIARLHAVGIVAGYADGTFRANEPVRRDQLASLMARTWEQLER